MFGTKWPSITSRWIQSAPAASTLRISSPSLEKSEASTDGAMTRGRGANGWDMALPGHVGGSERCRVTRAPKRGNAAQNFSCGRKFLPLAADVAGAPGSRRARKALILLGFSAGTAFAEWLGERIDAARSAAIVGFSSCCL